MVHFTVSASSPISNPPNIPVASLTRLSSRPAVSAHAPAGAPLEPPAVARSPRPSAAARGRPERKAMCSTCVRRGSGGGQEGGDVLHLR
eukprot:1178507-Prorocentrum_minimum.AAC.1